MPWYVSNLCLPNESMRKTPYAPTRVWTDFFVCSKYFDWSLRRLLTRNIIFETMNVRGSCDFNFWEELTWRDENFAVGPSDCCIEFKILMESVWKIKINYRSCEIGATNWRYNPKLPIFIRFSKNIAKKHIQLIKLFTFSMTKYQFHSEHLLYRTNILHSKKG